jgi:hypothetical protein
MILDRGAVVTGISHIHRAEKCRYQIYTLNIHNFDRLVSISNLSRSWEYCCFTHSP